MSIQYKKLVSVVAFAVVCGLGMSVIGVLPAMTAPARTHDAWLKDCLADDGTEPSSTNCDKNIHNSPDIVGRLEDNYDVTKFSPDDQQNAVAGDPYFVYVRLRNPGPYGTGTANGHLTVYYVRLGADGLWPPPPPPPTAHWQRVGDTDIVGCDHTGSKACTPMIPWQAPDLPADADKAHYCFLAVYHTYGDVDYPDQNFDDPTTLPTPAWTSPLWPPKYNTHELTTMSNNVAWRNFNVVAARSRDFAYEIRHSKAQMASIDLELRRLAGDTYLMNYGVVTLELPRALAEAWQGDGYGFGGPQECDPPNQEAVCVWVNQSTLDSQIDPNGARLQGIPVEADHSHTIFIRYGYPDVVGTVNVKMALLQYIDGEYAGGATQEGNFDPKPVDIDIRPESPLNRVNPDIDGWVPVIIYGNFDVPVAFIEQESLVFSSPYGGGGPVAHTEGRLFDLDGDGSADMMFNVWKADIGIPSGLPVGTPITLHLAGDLRTGQTFLGSDVIYIWRGNP